jgi:hypothetical protein
MYAIHIVCTFTIRRSGRSTISLGLIGSKQQIVGNPPARHLYVTMLYRGNLASRETETEQIYCLCKLYAPQIPLPFAIHATVFAEAEG